MYYLSRWGRTFDVSATAGQGAMTQINTKLGLGLADQGRQEGCRGDQRGQRTSFEFTRDNSAGEDQRDGAGLTPSRVYRGSSRPPEMLGSKLRLIALRGREVPGQDRRCARFAATEICVASRRAESQRRAFAFESSIVDSESGDGDDVGAALPRGTLQGDRCSLSSSLRATPSAVVARGPARRVRVLFALLGQPFWSPGPLVLAFSRVRGSPSTAPRPGHWSDVYLRWHSALDLSLHP